MASIYDNETVVLPSVKVKAWEKHKLQSWMGTYGYSYKRLIEELIYEIRISYGTADPRLASPHRDLHEAMGRVLDRACHRDELEGRLKPPSLRSPYHRNVPYIHKAQIDTRTSDAEGI